MVKTILKYRLTERRTADRETMAKEIETLVKKHNWNVERCELNTSTETRLNLTGPRGLAITIEFESKSCMPDNYCMPWHFNYTGDRGAKLSDNFARYQGSYFDNTHHRRKCTVFASGIDTLIDKLEVAMEMANGISPFGSAFKGVV